MATQSPVSLEDRASIGDGIHLFYDLVDSGHASKTIALFTSDAKLTFGPGSPQPGTIEGSAIHDAMIAREALKTAFTRHAVSNVRFQREDDVVTTHYLLTLYRSDDATRSSVPAFVADVIERWKADGTSWRIGERTILPAFARP